MRLRSFLTAAFTAILWPVASDACNIGRISGLYDVNIVQTRFQQQTGDVRPSSPFDFGTAHTTCQFKIGRINARKGRINVTCELGWLPARHWERDPYPKPFAQDGIVFTGDEHRTWPWHQLHRDQGCRWEIVDLNEVELTIYRVSFSMDGQSLTGKGADHQFGPDGGHFGMHVTTFNGVKVRR